MNAFEELKAWCEKHLSVGEYQVVEESRLYVRTIYFDMCNNEHPFMCFSARGAFCSAGVVTDEDMLEHIRDLEAAERERGTISCEQ